MRTVVAITGASSGIGAVFARRLAPEHDLLLIARRREKLEDLGRELSDRHGSHIEILTADLANEKDLQTVAERLEQIPNLALLVNNAGFGTKGLFWEAPLDVQEQMHRLHVMAVVRLCHVALKNMVARDCGAIINVASIAAYVRTAGSASYSATKSWMSVFTEGLHLELQAVRANVSVQALCPGFTYSEFHDVLGVDRAKSAPPGFWLTAEEVVDASLAGLARKQLFVIPGWRYRLLAAFLGKLPSAARLRLEAATSRRKRDRIAQPSAPSPQISKNV